ncbi:DUF6233 domain-containing protein, partial [Streptomyces sp. NPDC056227]|uniref:DUF6233 domain-containing protein n=1 Tax=Streptomyces sp. NPDC056227 TaxID=3345753 RepID=UPI0035DBCF66
ATKPSSSAQHQFQKLPTTNSHSCSGHKTSNNTHPVSAQDARMALADAQLEACVFCRPDTELGILD